jgi:hypothetical protein
MRHRSLAVTFTLILAGALVGAGCGLLALLPIPLLHALHPTPDDALVTASDVAPLAVAAGAALGGVLAPIFAWGLLRRAPIWRLMLEPAAGTVFGSLAGWALGFRGWIPGIPGFLGCALLGAFVAGLRLRLATQRVAAPSISKPLSNER